MSVLTTTDQKSQLALHVERMQTEADRVITIREKTVGRSVPIKDDLGQVYRHEWQLVPIGTEVFFKEEPSKELVEFILKPASDGYITKTLTNLHAHKPYGRGEEAFAVIIRDLVNDLKGYSHWAIKKVCENFRKDTEITFFPDTAQILQQVRTLQDQLRWKGEEVTPGKKYPDPKEDPVPRSPDGCVKVAAVLHNAGLPHDKTFCAACKEAEKEVEGLRKSTTERGDA